MICRRHFCILVGCVIRKPVEAPCKYGFPNDCTDSGFVDKLIFQGRRLGSVIMQIDTIGVVFPSCVFKFRIWSMAVFSMTQSFEIVLCRVVPKSIGRSHARIYEKPIELPNIVCVPFLNSWIGGMPACDMELGGFTIPQVVPAQYPHSTHKAFPQHPTQTPTTPPRWPTVPPQYYHRVPTAPLHSLPSELSAPIVAI